MGRAADEPLADRQPQPGERRIDGGRLPHDPEEVTLAGVGGEVLRVGLDQLRQLDVGPMVGALGGGGPAQLLQGLLQHGQEHLVLPREVAAVYTSPLRRARETAAFLSPAAVALDGLTEVGGTGEYVAAEVMRANGDPRYAALISGDLTVFGADADAFRALVAEAIDGIVDRHPGETVAVVSHAGVINGYLGSHLAI